MSPNKRKFLLFYHSNRLGYLHNLLYILLNRYIVYTFQVFFPIFLKSQIYYNYLTELLNSISGNHSSQTLSTSVGSVDDVRSLGTQSEENSRLVKSTFGSDTDLTEHPDALWQRPNPG